MFETAHEFADHLSALIDDDALVVEAVRRKFPFYKGLPQRMSKRERNAARGPRSQEYMSKSDGAYTTEISQISFTRNMEEGSKKLLTALWTNHAPILMRLSENENCTVMRA